jgi:hypothetical protein
MNISGLPGGVPALDQVETLQPFVEQALLISGAPGALEATDAGIAPSRRLSRIMVAGLTSLYQSTSVDMSMEGWLADALGLDEHQLAESGPAALGRLIRDAFDNPEAEYGIPPMTVEDDRSDQEQASEARDAFGVIADDLPTESP